MRKHPTAWLIETYPRILSLVDLVDFLELDSLEELDWLTIPNRLRGAKLQHYRSRLIKKRSGGYRWIDAPRARLRFAQQRILHGILDCVRVSDACCGFVTGRNVRQFASLHSKQSIVLRMDLEDFFPNIHTGSVNAMWRTLGYPNEVSQYLTWLCTIPRRSIELDLLSNVPYHQHGNLLDQCSRDRLPQGAPTSGALANLIAYRMDQRFLGLSNKLGGRYSRYADDLAFSWPKIGRRHLESLKTWIAVCVLECGFRVNYRKTRVMHSSQRQILSGVVVNESPCLARSELDCLRAILFNCVQHGHESQNLSRHVDFRSHLQGRIAWAMHLKPTAGARLQRIFDRILW
jgi:RNA-directed DNA polymerase